MTPEQAREFVLSLYPEGEERWIKVKYLDSERCSEVIRFKNDLDLGFEFTAIGTVEGFVPQVSALAELREEMRQHHLIGGNTEIYQLMERMFANKIEEYLNKHTQKVPY